MSRYAVPSIFIFFIGAFLAVAGWNSFQELIRMLEGESGMSLKKLLWFAALAFCWYKFLTTAYRIEITGDGAIHVTSLTWRITLQPEDILGVSEWGIFVNVNSNKGRFSVSTLMDGTGNILNVLQSLVLKVSADRSDVGTLSPDHQTGDGSESLKTTPSLSGPTAIVYRAVTFRLCKMFLILLVITYINYEQYYDPSSPDEFFFFTGIYWVLFCTAYLFGIRSVEVKKCDTIIISRLVGTRLISPQDILCVKDGLSGTTLVLRDKTIRLSHWIDNIDGFKSMLRTLNPSITFIDTLNDATRSKLRIVLIMIGVFALLALQAAFLFYLMAKQGSSV